MAQYGIRMSSGNIVTDADWACIADVIKGFGAFGYKNATQAGTLMVFDAEDKEWKEVQQDAKDSDHLDRQQ